MTYDDWKLMTPEEDADLRRPRRRRRLRSEEDYLPERESRVWFEDEAERKSRTGKPPTEGGSS